MKILLSDCCGVERGSDPDLCPQCGGVCTFAFTLSDIVEEHDQAIEAGEFDEDEETFHSLSCGLSDEDERKANFEELDDENPELDDLPGNWEPDWGGTTAREQQLSSYNQKF